MKRILSITLALLLLSSGLHLTVASHYCGGVLAHVKWSFNHELAGCGMEGDGNRHSDRPEWQEACCQDVVQTLITDGSFDLSKTPTIACDFQPLFRLTVYEPSLLDLPESISSGVVFPPGDVQPSRVQRASICVFRI